MKKICIIFLLFLLSIQLFADDDEKLRLAVMEFEDRSGTLSKQLLSDATEYLRGALISANKYTIIAKERQDQAIIKEMKKESYKECNDKNCQIPLGQALSADTILMTTITRLGTTFVIASELIDLAKEATVVGAREKFDGTENSMSEALDKIAEKVIAAYESIQDEENSKSEENYSQNENSNYNNYTSATERDEKRIRVEAEENLRSGRVLKKTGLSILGIGGGLVLIGGILVAAGEGSSDYDSESGMISGGIAMCSLGWAAVITGVIMAPVGAVREKKARIELNSLSIAPANGGMFASVGFSF